MTTTTGPQVPVHRQLSAHAATRLLGDWQSKGPAYRALADALRAAILSGALGTHTRLPSERDLALSLGVSRTTTTAAYRELRERGFAQARTGVGTVTVLPRHSGPAPTPSLTGGDAPRPQSSAPHGDLIDLGQAAPAAPPDLHDAYQRALEALPRYLSGIGYEPLGIHPLRVAIAERYTARGTPTSAENILVTSGAQHAITTLAQALLGAGERAIVQSPTYAHALAALRGAGARLVGVPVGTPGQPGPPPFDVDLFESTVRRSAPRLAYMIADNHNPTGYTWTEEERRRVRAVARRHRMPVIGDETITDLYLDRPSPAPLTGDGQDDTHVIAVGSASKSFWGGLRVGWVRAHPELVRRLALRRESIDIATSVLEQLAVVDLLERSGEILAARRVQVARQRDHLVAGLRRIEPSWRVPEPPGGLSLWLDLGVPLGSALAAASAERGLLINAGPALTPDGSHASQVRLTFAPSTDRIDAGLPRLADAWARVSGRAAGSAP
ncbi:DNA-binding transcriptional regulator, MocR family, contains an aminotransferase domain [Paraoerskovia marina]|uniref:DNA-binding transcriptional regulator, MocR family, contains an aminotransferase domain n=1 Tax=Paraoerskovia marina TaxID=545619 RepID=A0A1H1S674_9CELL|nr:PLP-dependent aminotransferase family protein [Paraoerskovia marina]SDS43268.1 DNA-binding transcriptional regulator, MocR family, contains an aminotransferase domain [Paraoerskovia marina]